MSRTKKIALAIVFFIVFFFVIAKVMHKQTTKMFLNMMETDRCIANANSIKKDDYAGIVTHKYIEREKGMGKVLLLDIGLERAKPILLNGKIGGVYEQIVIGDSLVKELGVLSIQRWRKGNNTTLDFVIDCE